MSLGRYAFLPWLRRGIGNEIQTDAGAGSSRAALDLQMNVRSESGQRGVPPKHITLVGPGDVTGINAHQVIRTEPRAGVADFEPNYLACIDLYDEDFPWRYSPLRPDLAKHRLVPWLTLIVLQSDEFTMRVMPGRPLPAFELTPAANVNNIFPAADQVFAWAHVHLNAPPGSGTAPDLAQLRAMLDGNPDIGYARLVCPRKLKARQSYVAIVTTVFEVGRKAGLGQAVADTEDGSKRAWDGGAKEFPIYYQWSFRTGVEGDFESLVRALVPRDMDPRVGIRDMDIHQPGFGVDDVHNPPDDRVGLEGALLAPTTVRRGLAADSDFVPKIVPVLNAPADGRAAAAGPGADIGEDDPLVSPPIHGCWHAGVERVGTAASDAGWVNDLNLDPRHRAAAGLGARVVRTHQERYMRSAWEQIGDVITVNHTIRRAQLATKASAAIYLKTYSPLPPELSVAAAAPLLTKVKGSPATLHALLLQSRLPRAALSIALRKKLRPRGLMARRMLPAENRFNGMVKVISGINDGTLSAAPPRPDPKGATVEGASGATAPSGALRWLARNGWWLLLLLLVLLALTFVFAPLALAILLTAAVAAAAAVIAPKLGPAERAQSVADMLSPAGMTIDAAVAIPPNNGFELQGTSADATINASAIPTSGAGDNAAARDFRRALIDFHEALSTRVPELPPRPAFDLANAHAKLSAALEPHRAIGSRYASLLLVGDRDVIHHAANYRGAVGATMAEVVGWRAGAAAGGQVPGPRWPVLQEVMNYPDIKEATYAPLADISDEYFVPNLKLIPNNTISLMKTNQEFIESYLVGANHEFARELLWREYPTDQRGSCLRQFWDIAGYVDRQKRTAKQLAEDLKDIPRIPDWGVSTPLGGHNNRDAQGDKTQVVLVLRGDLLKRYPNTFIYAQRATWGQGQRQNRLVLSDESGELYLNSPDDARLCFPLYRARVRPDIHFIGFDLTLEDVKGDATLDESAQSRATLSPKQLGWFFVLQEVPGEPRFGLDVQPPTDPAGPKWDKLSWVNVDVADGGRIDLSKPLKNEPSGNDEGVKHWADNAADLAYVLYQKPVMVGVHGREMLKNLKTS